MSARAGAKTSDERAGSAGRDGRAARVIGVLGAGTMGAGIAQLACARGRADAAARPDPGGAREGAASASRDGLRQGSGQGPALEREQAEQASASLDGGRRRLTALAPCELVIEAVPERLELKHELYAPAVGDRRRGVRAGEQHLLAAR